MRNLFLLLISFAGLVRAEAPPNIELTFSLTRNGSHMAEVTEKLEYSGGNYQLTEIWKGKRLYALMGQARRIRRGPIDRATLSQRGQTRPRAPSRRREGRHALRAGRHPHLPIIRGQGRNYSGPASVRARSRA